MWTVRCRTFWLGFKLFINEVYFSRHSYRNNRNYKCTVFRKNSLSHSVILNTLKLVTNMLVLFFRHAVINNIWIKMCDDLFYIYHDLILVICDQLPWGKCVFTLWAIVTESFFLFVCFCLVLFFVCFVFKFYVYSIWKLGPVPTWWVHLLYLLLLNSLNPQQRKCHKWVSRALCAASPL